MSAVRTYAADEGVLDEALHAIGCVCGRAWLGTTDRAGGRCPGCGREGLEPQPAVLRDTPPELLVPFAHSREDLLGRLRSWAGIWHATADLTARNLVDRAEAVWWPVWLVDATAVGTFSAEVGFDVEVQSSEEVHEGGRWQSRAVMRTKTRWEPRVGRLVRRHRNVAAAALRDHGRLVERLGTPDRARAVEFTPDKLAGAMVRLPDVPPDDAWPGAEALLHGALGDEIARAVDAQHVRGVSLQARYTDVEWTWLLVPVYASWYRDDDGAVHVVLIDGTTGEPSGPRRASVRRALGWSAILGLVATATLVGAGAIAIVGLALWFLLPVAALVAGLALAIYLAALVPPLRSWTRNRRETPGEW